MDLSRNWLLQYVDTADIDNKTFCDRMTDSGNSLFLIEHNSDVLRQADYLIELGPGGGEAGGRILFAGSPEAMLSCPESVTKDYL